VSENLLLDTCALIWLVNEPECLGERQRQALQIADKVAVSAISCAELACLEEKGRLTLDRNWKQWFEHFTHSNGISILDVDYHSLTEAFSLPDPFHRDPCDRIIVGTARKHSLKIVTGDEKILQYPYVEKIT